MVSDWAARDASGPRPPLGRQASVSRLRTSTGSFTAAPLVDLRSWSARQRNPATRSTGAPEGGARQGRVGEQERNQVELAPPRRRARAAGASATPRNASRRARGRELLLLLLLLLLRCCCCCCCCCSAAAVAAGEPASSAPTARRRPHLGLRRHRRCANGSPRTRWPGCWRARWELRRRPRRPSRQCRPCPLLPRCRTASRTPPPAPRRPRQELPLRPQSHTHQEAAWQGDSGCEAGGRRALQLAPPPAAPAAPHPPAGG